MKRVKSVKTKVVSSDELSSFSLRAEDYVDLDTKVPVVWITAFKGIVKLCHGIALNKRWWRKYAELDKKTLEALKPEIISSKLMLTVTELSEAVEELRNSKSPQEIYYDGDKPEGFGIELADAVIRIFDVAEWLGIDITECIYTKIKYNATRPALHGGKKL